MIRCWKIDKYDDNSLRGVVLEVDIEYSRELYELYNSYSLAKDKLEIKWEILSDYIN